MTKSVLRERGFPGLSTLNFQEIAKEVETQCPTVFKLLSQMIQLSHNSHKKTAPLALIYGIIMFRRCKELSRVQRVNTVLLNDGGASQEVCRLLNFLNIQKPLHVLIPKIYRFCYPSVVHCFPLREECNYFCGFWLCCNSIFFGGEFRPRYNYCYYY